jgi:hypothetical protein
MALALGLFDRLRVEVELVGLPLCSALRRKFRRNEGELQSEGLPLGYALALSSFGGLRVEGDLNRILLCSALLDG